MQEKILVDKANSGATEVNSFIGIFNPVPLLTRNVLQKVMVAKSKLYTDFQIEFLWQFPNFLFLFSMIFPWLWQLCVNCCALVVRWAEDSSWGSLVTVHPSWALWWRNSKLSCTTITGFPSYFLQSSLLTSKLNDAQCKCVNVSLWHLSIYCI